MPSIRVCRTSPYAALRYTWEWCKEWSVGPLLTPLEDVLEWCKESNCMAARLLLHKIICPGTYQIMQLVCLQLSARLPDQSLSCSLLPTKQERATSSLSTSSTLEVAVFAKGPSQEVAVPAKACPKRAVSAKGPAQEVAVPARLSQSVPRDHCAPGGTARRNKKPPSGEQAEKQ